MPSQHQSFVFKKDATTPYLAIAVSDPDGDTVRCRWASGSECASICNGFPGAVLNSASCAITYWANDGTGYRAAAIVIEDFSPNYAEPLSSVGLQFLVFVVKSIPILAPNSQPSFLQHCPRAHV